MAGFYTPNSALNFWAANVTSGAPNNAVITATLSAPAAINCDALSCVIPPMATTGTLNFCFASVNNEGVERTAPGLTVETKKLPNAM